MNTRLVLLPGMDGTGKLFEPLQHVLPAHIQTTVVSYPTELPLGYDELLPFVLQALPPQEPCVLLGESFSGPLALMVATKTKNVTGVILCASFIKNPLPSGMSWLRSVGAIAALCTPKWIKLRVLLGVGAAKEVRQLVSEALSSVPSRVMAFRAKCINDIDCTKALRECKVPILYMAATDDTLVSRRSLELMRSVRPDIAVVTLKGPHLLLQRSPLAAVQVIQDFLENVKN